MMGWSPGCYTPSFVEIDPPVPEKIFEGFLPHTAVLQLGFQKGRVLEQKGLSAKTEMGTFGAVKGAVLK